MPSRRKAETRDLSMANWAQTTRMLDFGQFDFGQLAEIELAEVDHPPDDGHRSG